MKKLLLTLGVLLSVYSLVYAQSPNRFQIQGTAADTSGTPLNGATVMLLQRKDSALVSYGRANEKGFFTLKNVKKGDYLVKLSYVGYIPFEKNVPINDSEVIDLGLLKMKLITKELYEVVVKTARAPLTIRGDTIEYNASSFKVPPGATVEDLLRKLPGVQIDANGNIKAQGKEVKKVLVDGKSFFGNDPKMATQNLPAEAITKVQIFNDKSEQSKITGVDDGQKEKAINLELKDSFKKGGFGKITAGVGNIDRAMTKLNYNKFDKTNQFALVGLANNTNEGGMSFDDFRDFRGSNAFNWSDNADFGFGSNNYISFGGSDDDSGGGLSIPIDGGYAGQGFANNVGLGANYNYDTKKNKLSTSYYYNSQKRIIDALNNQQTFLPNNQSFTNNSVNSRINFNGNHRITARYEKTIDSLNTVVVINNSRINAGNSTSSNLQNITRNENIKTNESTLNNANTVSRLDMSNTFIYRHKFKKKGRSFALSAALLINDSDGSATQESVNQFYGSTTTANFIKNINQGQTSSSSVRQIKASGMFLEPLSKKIFWETFYNFSIRKDEVSQIARNLNQSSSPIIDSLGAVYTNDLSYNRLGSSLRYSSNGINISAGLAAQRFSLKGRFANSPTAPTFKNVDKTFDAILPFFNANLDLQNNQYMGFGYRVNVTQPSTRNLQPVINNSNPLYIQEGNPNLLPEVSRGVDLNYNFFDPATFINTYISLDYNYKINQIVNTQIVDAQTLITRSKPINISGGQRVSSYLSFGMPIVKTKLSFEMGSNIGLNKNLTFINEVLNEEKSQNYAIYPRIDWTPSDNFTFFLNTNLNVSYTKYSINTTQNMKLLNNSYNATMNIKMPKLYFLTTSLNYQTFINARYGFDQKISIWNASVYKILGKDKKAEIRLTANDILNRNLGISQNASQNFVSREQTATLAQYFILSFSYNMRGLKATLKKDNW